MVDFGNEIFVKMIGDVLNAWLVSVVFVCLGPIGRLLHFNHDRNLRERQKSWIYENCDAFPYSVVYIFIYIKYTRIVFVEYQWKEKPIITVYKIRMKRNK